MDSIQYKEWLLKSLFELGILCYPSSGKVGLKGWNDFTDKEEYLRRALALLKNNPELNLAVNLGLSNVICIDIDDPNSFQRLYNPENFLTLSCRTPRGHHFFLQNDIGLEDNISLPKFGVEILCKNHLAIIHGENYQLDDLKEIRKASEYKSFFDFILDISNSQSLNKDNTLSGEYCDTHIYNRKKNKKEYCNTHICNRDNSSILIHTSIRGERGGEVFESEIFSRFAELEKEYSFIKFVFELVFGVEPKKNMLCVLHSEKNPSASVFRSNKTFRWVYKDFHPNGEVYSILDLLLEYFNVSERLRKVFQKAFAIYLVQSFYKRDEDLKIVNLLRGINEDLSKSYLLIKAINSLRGEVFLGVRDFTKMLRIKNITSGNRILNYLCLIGLLEKVYYGVGKACGYRIKDINIEELEKELERTKKIDIYRLSKERALEYFDKEKVEEIYKRAVEEKKELVGAIKKIFKGKTL